MTDTADTLTWVLGDHLGSASTTANENGTLNSVIQYTAFGEIRLTQGLTPTKYRYTGQLAQAELGLDFYVSRFYDPLTAHFTSADTLIPEPGRSQSYNRYAYVYWNPIKFRDPSGHDVGCAGTDASNCRKKNEVIDRNLGYKKTNMGHNELEAIFTKSLRQYGVILDNGSASWNLRYIKAAYSAVVNIAFKLSINQEGLSLNAVFMKKFNIDSKTPLVLRRENETIDPSSGNIITGGGLTNNSHSITIMKMDYPYDQSLVNNIVHELGHAYSVGNSNIENQLPDDYVQYRSEILVPNGVLKMGSAYWQLNPTLSKKETFADSFLAWTYNVWLDTDLAINANIWFDNNLGH